MSFLVSQRMYLGTSPRVVATGQSAQLIAFESGLVSCFVVVEKVGQIQMLSILNDFISKYNSVDVVVKHKSFKVIPMQYCTFLTRCSYLVGDRRGGLFHQIWAHPLSRQASGWRTRFVCLFCPGVHLLHRVCGKLDPFSQHL